MTYRKILNNKRNTLIVLILLLILIGIFLFISGRTGSRICIREVAKGGNESTEDFYVKVDVCKLTNQY